MKVCLVNPPSGGNVQYFLENPYPPQSLLYLGSWLEKEGHTVAVVDCMLEGFDHKQLSSYLRQLQPDVVGITMTSSVRHSGLQCAQVAKSVNPKVLTVVGGVHVTFLDEEVLKHYPSVDVVVRGEGEVTFGELLNGGPRQQVLGITYREGDTILRTADRPQIHTLDTFPMPAFHLVPMERYFNYAIRYQNHLSHPAGALSTARGCVGKCTFCSTPGMWQGVRVHSPEYIVEEIYFLQQKYGTNDFRIFDDTFPATYNWLVQFTDLLRKRSMNIKYRCLSRVTSMNEDTIKLLKETGCYFIKFGIESGSPEIIKSIQKKIKVEQVREAIHRVTQTGIGAGAFFMVGFPGESKADVYKTLCLARSLPLSETVCGNTFFLPASQMTKEAHLEPKVWFNEDTQDIPAFQHKIYSHSELEGMAWYIQYAALWNNFGRVFRFSLRTIHRPKIMVIIDFLRNFFKIASHSNKFPFNDFEKRPHWLADKLLVGLYKAYHAIRPW